MSTLSSSTDPIQAPSRRDLRIWPAILLLAVAMLAVLGAAWNATAVIGELNASTTRRATARQGLLQVERLLSLFKDIESGSRGFAISGRDEYLAPYREALAALPAVRGELHRLLGDPAPDGRPWAELDALLERRLSDAGRVIERRRQLGEAVIRELSLFDEGKAAMDAIRTRTGKIGEVHKAQIAVITGDVHRLQQESAAWLALATGFAMLLVGSAAYLLLIERRRRLRLEQRLRDYGDRLEQAVAERTRELSEALARLEDFARHENAAVEAERHRLAREVHDQIGQVFTAIRLIAGSLPRAAFPPGQETALAQALDLGIASTRHVTAELRPPLLDDLGLAAALNHYAGGVTAQSGIACRANLAADDRLSAAQALALYRIAQEAVTNALRHAGASAVEITGRALNDEYLLDIKDDGRGLGDNPSRPGALGVTGMRERAALLGGRCEVGNDADGGARVRVRLPLEERNESKTRRETTLRVAEDIERSEPIGNPPGRE